ncbi:uncharacterized protein L969DRAFT_85938 [Mixia osmundae IAM 14324]|uniref:Impact N-terminal domain-containing protein n=1 Tax=Mixia osmundae (strain CBS 9802 / IAM 14324 / JCM 22182 / KY 12970) TaxID=764103 RepID=G7E5M4_MIXOS|nr:uncharacterized protein L969DRAFT_85938 [Mixia osmundae IAM 14324]KEI40718.1 hypothetical protein L969DRAFT_85938 [Mixia osmundae IAM 14324]GAA98134.1 hypothetical protein E5Q_04817 [Mixia osmundae IAM 14324]
MSKRAGPNVPQPDSVKRPRPLDSWLSLPQTQWDPLATSSTVVDRDSCFVAYATSITSKADALAFQAHVKVLHEGSIGKGKLGPASHNVLAWRTITLRPGKNGLGEQGDEDFEVAAGSHNDGEDRAGPTMLNVLEKEGVVDVVVIVSRWFGGTMLGPIRFKHIEDVTRDVIRKWLPLEEKRMLLKALAEADKQIATLVHQTKLIAPEVQATDRPAAFDALSTDKAQKLLRAREGRIAFLEQRLAKLTRERNAPELAKGSMPMSSPVPMAATLPSGEALRNDEEDFSEDEDLNALAAASMDAPEEAMPVPQAGLGLAPAA